MTSIVEIYNKLPRFTKFNYSGKKVLLRVDINVPIDKEKKVILDDFRIQAHSETIKKLIDQNAAVVVIAHQGRPGDKEFTSLELHAQYLSKYLGTNVKFIEDVIGPTAREEIRKLKSGEVLLLDNVRFISEEMLEKSPEEHSKSFLVQRLSPFFNYFVLDAFAAIHRPHASIVGFAYVLPSSMGYVLEKEVDAMYKILTTKRENIILIAGGAKIPETIKAIKKVLEVNIVDKILVGGFVGAIFTAAKIGLKGWYRSYIEKKNLINEVNTAKQLIEKYGDKIILPDDQVILINGEKKIVSIENVEHEIMDLGDSTIVKFKELIKNYEVSIMTGPLGFIEKDEFTKGTLEIMNAMIQHTKFSVIGGGHTVIVARKYGLISKLSHVSTGGRAFLYSIAGEKLPGLEALIFSSEKFG